MDVRNFDVLHIEPSGVPVPDGFVRGVRRIHPSGAEHESHASAVYHHLILRFFLHSEKELPQTDVRANSEVAFAKSHEVGKEEVGVGTDVVWLEPVGSEDGEEEFRTGERERPRSTQAFVRTRSSESGLGVTESFMKLQ